MQEWWEPASHIFFYIFYYNGIFFPHLSTISVYVLMFICLLKNVINMTFKYRNIILRDESALQEFQIRRFLSSM